MTYADIDILVKRALTTASFPSTTSERATTHSVRTTGAPTSAKMKPPKSWR